MSVEELNLLIDTDCLNPRLIALIKDGQILKSQAYIQNNHLIPGAIRRHLGEGVTLSVRALHETNPAIAAFCRQLADELGHPTQANCYLTPSGHQGFAHHWDPHITVIIQISGKKTWDLYAPMIPDPVYPQLAWTTVGFTDTQRQYLESHDPDYSITLLPGDVLWIPRGWIHNPYAPEAGAEPSLHLTIGIVQRTFHWVATRLLEEAIHDPPVPQGSSAVRCHPGTGEIGRNLGTSRFVVRQSRSHPGCRRP